MADDNSYNLINLKKQIIDDVGLPEPNIFEAINGQEAFDLVMDNIDFDLLLLDYQMPLLDGLQVAAKVKELYISKER